MGKIIKNVKLAMLNISIANVFLNTKILNMNTNIYAVIKRISESLKKR